MWGGCLGVTLRQTHKKDANKFYFQARQSRGRKYDICVLPLALKLSEHLNLQEQ